MTPVATTFFFYFLAIMAIVSAIAVITRRNPVHAALALIVTLLSLAGFYLMLYATFVAGVQIVLYAGGIMVLFLFVIMLVNLDDAAKVREYNRQWPVALAAVAAVAAELGYFFHRGAASFHIVEGAAAGGAAAGNTEALADSLFSEYLLPFEIASLVLLVAVVGSVIMAKKRI